MKTQTPKAGRPFLAPAEYERRAALPKPEIRTAAYFEWMRACHKCGVNIKGVKVGDVARKQQQDEQE